MGETAVDVSKTVNLLKDPDLSSIQGNLQKARETYEAFRAQLTKKLDGIRDNELAHAEECFRDQLNFTQARSLRAAGSFHSDIRTVFLIFNQSKNQGGLSDLKLNLSALDAYNVQAGNDELAWTGPIPAPQSHYSPKNNDLCGELPIIDADNGKSALDVCLLQSGDFADSYGFAAKSCSCSEF